MVKGKGTDLSNEKRLKSWAKKKQINQAIMIHLINVAKELGDLKAEKSYRNTFYCFNSIKSSGISLYGNYCKNRFCSLCCGILKAKRLNQYMPVMSNWKECRFLTLTVKSPHAEGLRDLIREMYEVFNRIIERWSKRKRRGKAIKLIGIKVLECNFNPLKKTYNPHFHIITANKITARILKAEWIKDGGKLWGKYSVAEWAQKNLPINNLQSSLIEVLKYSSKIFTDPLGVKRRKGEKFDPIICVAAYHCIISAMKGRRVFDRFGFNLPPQRKQDSKIQLLKDYKEWIFDTVANDWVEIDRELMLSNYNPTQELSFLLSKNIETKIQ